MIVHDVVQRSPAWYALRCGRVTGSCANAILAVRQRGTGELAIRRDLRRRLVVERLTGKPVEDSNGYQSDDMRHGVETEADAFATYEAIKGELVTRVGFVSHDSLMAGCSPDGCVADWEGAIELKCPASSTHLDYLQAGVIPKDYHGQLIHTLWVTGAQWVDFCSFDSRFPDHLRLFCVRLYRSSVDFAAYELAVRLLLDEVDRDVLAMQSEPAVA